MRLDSPRSCYHDHELSADARGSLAFAGLLDFPPGDAIAALSQRCNRMTAAQRGAAAVVATQKLQK